MKNLIQPLSISLIFLFAAWDGIAQTNTENYVATYTPLTGKKTDSEVLSLPWTQLNQDIQYSDGLGRPIQTVRKKASPGTLDEISFVVYDALGREQRQYLPYTSNTGANGSFRPNAISEQQAFYQNQPNIAHTTQPFSEIKFEPSPLNRVTEQGAPGTIWAIGGGHTPRYSYLTNGTGEVPIIKLIGPNFLQVTGYYPAGELTLVVDLDENNHELRRYTDLQGRLICEMRYPGGGPSMVTYSVYDRMGRLRAILSPLGYQKLTQGATVPEVTELCFFYDYDDRGRKIREKIPGAEEELIVYDYWNRPVFTQDGLRRAAGEWYYMKYDSLSRIIETGLYKHPGGAPTQAALQQQVNSITQPQTSGNILFDDVVQQSQHNYQYTNYHATERVIMEPPGSTGRFVVNADSNYTFIAQIVNFPEPQFCGPLTYTYYDDYDIDNNGSDDASFDPAVNNAGVLSNSNSPLTPTKRTRSLMTVTKARVLYTDNWLTSSYFYDEKGRLIQVQNQNYMGGKDITSTEYTFTGKPLTIYTQHTAQNISTPPITIVEKFQYDHRERLKKHTHKINNEPAQTLSTTSLNELSQVRQKVLGTNGQQVDFEYNIRGWLKKINDPNLSSPTDLFGMELFYEDGPIPLFNGNISATQWQHRENGALQGVKRYHYTYDGADRLMMADYNGADGYDEGPFSYDANGNILSVKREGVQIGSSGAGAMDDLTYTYRGNQLIGVDDAINTANGSGYDFGDILNFTGPSQPEYRYDANGNMILDRNDHIRIVYNLLNKPDTVYFLDTNNVVIPGKFLHFGYDATGRKLWKVFANANITPTTRNDYAGVCYYTASAGGQSELTEIIHAEGMVLYKGTFDYLYHINDHLGNNRVTFRKNGNNYSNLAVQDYYPFGMLHRSNSNTSNSSSYRFGYQSQEKDNEIYGNGNAYSFLYRMHDPRIGRFLSIDPVSGTYPWNSPYSFCENRVIDGVDWEGKEWKATYDKNNVLNGYMWDPDHAYRITESGERVLELGYYHQAIFFTENGNFDPESDYNMGSSTAWVFKSDGTTQTFQASTYPSDVNDYPTVPEGLYEATVGLHRGDYTALRLHDIGNTNDRIELGYENPAHSDGRTYAEGVNIHKPCLNNKTGMTRSGDPCSAACLLVDINNWSTFIGLFDTDLQRNNPVSVTVSRTYSEPVVSKYEEPLKIPGLEKFVPDALRYNRALHLNK